MEKPLNAQPSLRHSADVKRNRLRLRGPWAERAGLLLLFSAFSLLFLSALGEVSTTGSTSNANGTRSPQTANSPSADTPKKQHGPLTTSPVAERLSRQVSFRNTDPKVEYVGSKACEACHESEFKSYLQTTHGLATTTPEGRAELRNLPAQGVTVCQTGVEKQGEEKIGGKKCYRVYPSGDGYYMREFDRSADGREFHAQTEKIAFALGKPLIATGYVVQRGDFLFEAPLTYYKEPVEGQVQGWGLSPGYGNDAVGFTRPVVDSCLTCHLGRPRPTDAASNRYLSPAYEELSIGCENCHGPGALHVKERQAGSSSKGIDNSIVNPKYLTSQLADETCMYCHEAGQARIPLPGKSFQDYRPGLPLLRTQAIFKSKLLLGWNVEEWSDEMATSACSRLSNGALRCSTCHDPHNDPHFDSHTNLQINPGSAGSVEQAADFYRSKCLTCHQSASCTLPLSQRQQTLPVDNCITCHMPQHLSPKLVKLGGRGTSHRITKYDGEPLPFMDTPRTAPDPETGLILVNSDAADAQSRLAKSSKEVMLSAYQGVLARDNSRMDLVEHYKALLESLDHDQAGNQAGGEDGERDSPSVLSALAGAELARGTLEGNRQAIKDLKMAVAAGSQFPKDYLLLADLESRAGAAASDRQDAAHILSLAIERFPYSPTPYQKLVECFRQAGEPAKASEILARSLKLFPSDDRLLQLAAAGKP